MEKSHELSSIKGRSRAEVLWGWQREQNKICNLHKITFASWIMFMQKLSPRNPFSVSSSSLSCCPAERHNFYDHLKVRASAVRGLTHIQAKLFMPQRGKSFEAIKKLLNPGRKHVNCVIFTQFLGMVVWQKTKCGCSDSKSSDYSHTQDAWELSLLWKLPFRKVLGVCWEEEGGEDVTQGRTLLGKKGSRVHD